MMRINKTKFLFSFLWICITILALFFFVSAFPTLSLPGTDQFLFTIKTKLAQQVVKTYVPGIYYGATYEPNKKNTISFAAMCISQWQPISVYLEDATFFETAIESSIETSMIASKESENDSLKTDSPENTPSTEKSSASPTPLPTENTKEALAQNRTNGITYSQEQLSSFSFLLNNFFTLDPTTTIDESLLNTSTLLSKDMTLKKDASKPQILIYHTHSQEEFADTPPGDNSKTIVGVGEYLTTLLRDVYGYNVIHNTTSYDIVNGELDRNKAYNQALKSVSSILEENPSIEVIIDLHRDGISGNKMTTMVNGKETSKIMFFNGLSRTAKNGEISYLYNPYIEDNLAFSLQLQLKAAQYYPNVMRPIYLKGYRYNLHLRPRCLLVEAGSQKNTFQEELNAMEVLADVLNMVLTEE